MSNTPSTTAPAFKAADVVTLLEEHLTEVGKHVVLETTAGDELRVRTEVDESTLSELVIYAIESRTDVDLGRFRITATQVDDDGAEVTA
jgi:hypothetical protein